MKKKNIRSLLSLILSFSLLITGLGLTVHANEGNPNLLITGQTVKKYNSENSTWIDIPNEGDGAGVISHGDQIKLRVDFNIPVIGDGGFDYFDQTYNDVRIKLSDHFSFTSDLQVEKDLLHDGKKVGTVTFVNVIEDSIKRAYAKIDFSEGHNDIFNGHYGGVSAWFEAELSYNGSLDENNEDDRTVSILDKEFTMQLPGDVITYTVDKVGDKDLDAGTIDWDVTITAYRGTDVTNPVALDGFVFEDNLAFVGAFVEGSFKVGATSIDDSLVYNAASNKLSYIFPGDTPSPQTIHFKTKISDNIMTNGGTVTNIADLKVDDITYHSDPADVVITAPSAIKTGEKKDGHQTDGTYNPYDRTITWHIDVDNKGRTLKDLTITDALPGDLEFVSAKWFKKQVDQGGNVTWIQVGDTWSSEPTDSKYGIGDVNYIGRLEIVSKVPDSVDSVTSRTYYNQATLNWKGVGDTPGSTGAESEGVGIGYNAFSKSGEQVVDGTVDDIANHQITWTIKVDMKGQSAADFVVYDLFVHDKTTTDDVLINSTGWPVNLQIGSSGITRNDGQKYISGSSNVSGVSIKEIELSKQDTGIKIGTLVKISGLQDSGDNETILKSQVLDPDIIAGNDPEQKVYNTASLYKGINRRSNSRGGVDFNNKILAKELLHRDEVANDYDSTKTINPNNRTTNVADGFHYDYKEAIFRLNVNAANLNFNGVETVPAKVFGEVVVTDTLPKGWGFEEFSSEEYYIIYETSGDLDTGAGFPATGSLTAGDLLNSGSTDRPHMELFETTDGRQGIKFTFTVLNKPYVILVKAKLTDETYAEYLKGKNNPTVVANTLNLTSGTWELDDPVTQNVSISSKLLDKKGASNQSEIMNGILRWEVNYTPFGLEVGDGEPNDPAVSTAIVDTLPEGIDLRTDSNGELIWEQDGNPNIEVYKLKLKSNGEHDVDGELTLEELKQWITYDHSSRQLTFTFPDGKQAYRLVYITDITDMPELPGTITNQVSLIGATGDGTKTGGSFKIQDLDAGAMMSRRGYLAVRKTDGGSYPLAEAEFTLYNTDADGRKGTPRAIRTTDSGGLAYFYGLVPGTYVLVETWDTGEYKVPEFEYVVIVADDFSTTVSGLPLVNGLPQIITNDNPFEVINYSTEELVGHLTIGKTVVDNPDGGYDLDSFEFTIVFEGEGVHGSSYTYIGHGGVPGGTIASGGTIALGHNQSITILGLPVGTTYTVTETNYQTKGYTTTIVGSDGSINTNVVKGVIDESHNTYLVDFTNTQTIGDLTIKKTVAGNAGDFEKKFKFYLVLEDADDTEYPYTIYNRDAEEEENSGYINSSDWFELAHGEYITIYDLPAGATYTVTEEDYSADGYYTVRTGDVGVIKADETKTAVFTNIRNVFYPGNLTITKTVTGSGADTKKSFDFVVTFNGATGTYNYTGVGVESGTIKSGDTISLAHGQSITITGLPEGSTYQVAEVEASAEGYIVEAVGDEGTILPNADAIAAFTNEHIISKIDVTGKKIWVGGPAEKPTIELQLYRDGVKFGEAVSLKNGTGSYIWTGLDQTDANGKAYKYTVDEVSVPENYKKSVSEDGLTVTNTFVDPDSEEDTGSQFPTEPGDESKPGIPQTGEGRSTSALGLALIVAGLAFGLLSWKQRPRKRFSGQE